MKVTKNTEHNSVEIDFGGVKPSEQVRALMKAYGFWWFGKAKCWCHTLEVDEEFFMDFIEKRIKPLVTAPAVDMSAAVSAMSEDEKQKLLALLMGK